MKIYVYTLHIHVHLHLPCTGYVLNYLYDYTL